MMFNELGFDSYNIKFIKGAVDVFNKTYDKIQFNDFSNIIQYVYYKYDIDYYSAFCSNFKYYNNKYVDTVFVYSSFFNVEFIKDKNNEHFYNQKVIKDIEDTLFNLTGEYKHVQNISVHEIITTIERMHNKYIKAMIRDIKKLKTDKISDILYDKFIRYFIDKIYTKLLIDSIFSEFVHDDRDKLRVNYKKIFNIVKDIDNGKLVKIENDMRVVYYKYTYSKYNYYTGTTTPIYPTTSIPTYTTTYIDTNMINYNTNYTVTFT